jgi:hypothetical protein
MAYLSHIFPGRERRATADEEHAVIKARAIHQPQMRKRGPCCRGCGRLAADHDHLYPARGTPAGPIYFDCWTDERLAYA